MATNQKKKKHKRITTRPVKKFIITKPPAATTSNKNKRRKIPQKPQFIKSSNDKINKKNKNKKHQKQQQKKNLKRFSSIPSSSSTAISNELDPERQIQTLLEPYSKDQLLELVCDAAVADQSLLAHIKVIADRDVSHRKIFVYGLGWDATSETLVSAFHSYGEIEDCKVVLDRVTGKAKGYGFVLFKSRDGAVSALKQPQKKIGNRMASCQLASIGSVGPNNQSQDTMLRKIYVSHVHGDVDPENLRAFFAKFGELEAGPLGLDSVTGKCRGFALFLYKTIEGANKALEEPHKIFEGHQLYCQKASDNKHKVPFSLQQRQQIQQQQTAQQQQQQQHQQIQQHQIAQQQAPMFAAMAVAQNLALFSQHPNLSAAYGTMAMNSHPGLVPGGAVNPLLAGPLHQSTFSSAQVQGAPFGSPIPGSSVGAPAGFGAYGVSQGFGAVGGNGSLNPAFPGMQSFHGSQMAQSSSRTLGTS
ncbi:hypothetical protein Scep_001972 [Stephania cephalantha]|uniref:RRM domain-containing protein n=1 Tax=Stephania cephalantha TaxID=152367 RepID=A0AAP0Q8B2_9MAGN